MVTGTAPYATSERRSPLSRIRALATEEPPRLADCLADADSEFCSVVDRMLSRNPDERFETPGDVAQALQPFTGGHDLKQAVAVAADAPAPATRLPLHQPRQPKPVRPEVAATTYNTSGPPSRIRTAAKFLIPIVLLAAAVFVFRLQTDKGELVVECNVPNVEVQILKDGEIHEEFSLKQGTTSISVFSGEYEIKIPTNADSIKVSTDRFTISRGSTLVAEIHYAKTANSTNTPNSVTAKNKVEPTYSGKTFSQWRTQLADRNPSQFEPALGAIGVLGVNANADEAGGLIFDTVKSLFRQSSKTAQRHTGAVEDCTRYMAVQAFRPLLDDPAGVELLREFLAEGDTAARRYALCILACREVKSASSAPGYASAQRALADMVPALVAASHDEDVTVRTSAISLTQSFEEGHPEVIARYVEMIGSEDFAEFYDISGILFDLAPEHRQLIGERHLKFYVDNIEAFRARRAQGERNALLGNYFASASDLLFAAIEAGVKSDQITDALFEILNDSRADVSDRAQAAYLLAVHSDKSAQVVPVLIELLQSDVPQLDAKCSIQGNRFNDDFGPSTQHYLSWRAAIFDTLGKLGSAAKDATPTVNSFLKSYYLRYVTSKFGTNPIDRTGLESAANAITALSQIGLNAESIPILQDFQPWPSFVNYKPDLAPLASRLLRSIPEEELKRLRGEGAEKALPLR